MDINLSIFTTFTTYVIWVFNKLDTITIGHLFSLLDLGIAFVIIGVLFPVLFNMFSNVVNYGYGGHNSDFKNGG